MNLLAFDTSTEMMTVALRTATQTYECQRTGGAQASQHLIATIQSLLKQVNIGFAQLDAIAFGAGPGAFTGLRASCAVAQGLGLGANVPLIPINTLHTLAISQHRHTQQSRITAALDARMDEIYWQIFDFTQNPLGTPCTQAQLARADSQNFVVGTLPQAVVMLDLAQVLFTQGKHVSAQDAAPLYVRNKVAQTTQERESAKAQAAAHTTTSAGAPAKPTSAQPTPEQQKPPTHLTGNHPLKNESTSTLEGTLHAGKNAASHLEWSWVIQGIQVARLELLPGVDEAEILQLETQPAHRRKGLAQYLVQTALDWARQQQRHALWLEVRRSNHAALALYQKMGFFTVNTRRAYYADGEDALVMKCPLAAKEGA